MAPVATPSRPISPSGACTSAADIWWNPELRPVGPLPGGAGGAPGVCRGTCANSLHALGVVLHLHGQVLGMS